MMLSLAELDELKSRPGNDCRSIAEKLGVQLAAAKDALEKVGAK